MIRNSSIKKNVRYSIKAKNNCTLKNDSFCDKYPSFLEPKNISSISLFSNGKIINGGDYNNNSNYNSNAYYLSQNQQSLNNENDISLSNPQFTNYAESQQNSNKHVVNKKIDTSNTDINDIEINNIYTSKINRNSSANIDQNKQNSSNSITIVSNNDSYILEKTKKMKSSVSPNNTIIVDNTEAVTKKDDLNLINEINSTNQALNVELLNIDIENVVDYQLLEHYITYFTRKLNSIKQEMSSFSDFTYLANIISESNANIKAKIKNYNKSDIYDKSKECKVVLNYSIVESYLSKNNIGFLNDTLNALGYVKKVCFNNNEDDVKYNKNFQIEFDVKKIISSNQDKEFLLKISAYKQALSKIN